MTYIKQPSARLSPCLSHMIALIGLMTERHIKMQTRSLIQVEWAHWFLNSADAHHLDAQDGFKGVEKKHLHMYNEQFIREDTKLKKKIKKSLKRAKQLH